MKSTFLNAVLTPAVLGLLVSTLTVTGCRDHPIDWDDGGTRETCKDVSIMAGVQDNFAIGNAEPSSPSEEMVAYMNYRYREVPNNYRNQLTMRFDETTSNRAFGHTFRLPDNDIATIKSATLTIHLKSMGGDNDAIHIVDATNHVDVKAPLWGVRLSSFNNGVWWSSEKTLILDLANLPPNSTYATNVLDALKDGAISVYVQDDTSVDYARLDVSYCTEKKDNNDDLF